MGDVGADQEGGAEVKFQLTVFPDGHAILGAPKDIGSEQAQHIRRLWDEWKQTPEAMLIIPDLDTVVVAETVEIELPVGGD